MRILFLKNLIVTALVLFIGMMSLAAHAQQLTGGSSGTAAQSDGEMAYWIPRCDQDKSGKPTQCEIFQRLLVKETGQRVAEFAIGYPEGKVQNARGVIVLPLGILLGEETSLRIDAGKSYSFEIRYCTQNGCYGFLDLTPAIIGELKRGAEASFFFTTLDGNNLQIDLSLAGFTKALETL